MVFVMSVGDRITELRKLQNMSQGKLAEAVGVTRQAVSKWENGTSLPDSLKMIKLSEVLDTDIEYLSTGRRNFARRPPVVLKTTETVEKIVEKPVVQVIEKVVEVEKPVVEVQYIDRPVVKKVTRTRYIRNPIEYCIFGVICFIFGLILGLLVA